MVIEKLCCALIWATKRLRDYMLYHTTWLISKVDPLEVYLQQALSLKPNYKVAGLVSRI